MRENHFPYVKLNIKSVTAKCNIVVIKFRSLGVMNFFTENEWIMVASLSGIKVVNISLKKL